MSVPLSAQLLNSCCLKVRTGWPEEVHIIHKGKGEGLGNKIKPRCGVGKLVHVWNVSDVAEGHAEVVL